MVIVNTLTHLPVKIQNPIRHFHPQKPGFALIVTLSLMILLTIIAVGLLTLSSISLRASTATVAMAEARQNARLSMQMAIAQLQSLTGQDTRVTAPKFPVSPTSNPNPVVPVTGAWRSWEGTDREADGRPKVPNYSAKKDTGDATATPEGAGAGRFLGWLTSSAEGKAADFSSVPGVSSAPDPSYIPLVSDGSVAEPTQKIFMKPSMVRNGQGAIAWWTSGENSKAMVNSERVAEPNSSVGWQLRMRSNGKADPQHFGLEKVDDYPIKTIFPTTGNLKLANPAAQLRKIHDLTAVSRGLLTNTATGGWRRDLSIFSEIFENLPSSDLPLYSPRPGAVQTFSKAPAAGNAANPVLYSWAGYRNNASGSAWEQVPPINSWSALVDYMTQYKSITTSSASRTAMPTFTGGVGGARYDFVDRVRRLPQIARIHWIYSLCSVKKTDPADPSKTHRLGLMVTPVLTLWNPYNVELAFNSIEIRIQQTTPLRFRFKVAGAVLQDTTLAEITKKNIDSYHTFFIKIAANTLRPGQSRIYGLNDPTPKAESAADDINLTPGYRPNGGFVFYGINKGADVYAKSADAFAVDRVTYDGDTQEYARDGTPKRGIGIIFDMITNGQSSSHRMIYNVPELGGDGVASAHYPPLTASILPNTTAGNVEGIRNLPFASAVFAYRMISPMSRDMQKHRHLFTKGMLQANPLCCYTEVGFGDDHDAVTSMQGTGVYHPVNAPYDFAFQDVSGGWNDSFSIPEYERSTNSSYIVSGMASGDGLTRCVMAELPTRPLQSLADLQHFDARNNNPIPPFQFNLIGNGSAHPIFAPDQVSVTTSFNNGMCNDDTYMLNHLFFDDWFVSSIAQELREFRSVRNRSIKQVYESHLNQTVPLPNRRYLPHADAMVVDGKVDLSKAVSGVDSRNKDSKTGLYGFETIASKLEVEGMFNVNSASLDAWKALLRQSRNAQVPYLASNGSTTTAPASSYPYPRTSISGDRATNSGSGDSNGSFPHAAEFAGHRVLTDEQIDALAEEIVKQVRIRGPFLSLSEFVNRQLTTNKDLAIASTIQKALDNLADLRNSPKNPFRVLQENSVEITNLPLGTTHDYKFPEAALGWSAFGVPGWIRQADILRPIAPILSARDDTFTIRAYGDSRDRTNQNKIVAKAWCEVVVQRNIHYVDLADPATVTPHSARMTSAANKRFGRRYEIVSFRWLDEKEV
jgi:hypothetical protein